MRQEQSEELQTAWVVLYSTRSLPHSSQWEHWTRKHDFSTMREAFFLLTIKMLYAGGIMAPEKMSAFLNSVADCITEKKVGVRLAFDQEEGSEVTREHVQPLRNFLEDLGDIRERLLA